MSGIEKRNTSAASDGRPKPKFDLGAVVDGAVAGLGKIKNAVTELGKEEEYRQEAAKKAALDALRNLWSGEFKNQVIDDSFNVLKRAPHMITELDNVARFDTEIVDPNSPQYSKGISFIQGHKSDFPANAELNPADVAYLVHVLVTTKDGDTEGTVVAVNAKNEVIGFAN